MAASRRTLLKTAGVAAAGSVLWAKEAKPGPPGTPGGSSRALTYCMLRSEGGTGLGVAVARGLIEQHGGQLEFKSAPGKGTIATLRLPAKAIFRETLPNPQRALKSGCRGAASPTMTIPGRATGA